MNGYLLQCLFLLEKPFLFPAGSKLVDLAEDEAIVPVNITSVPVVLFQNKETVPFVSAQVLC